jgi:hypothetical protein
MLIASQAEVVTVHDDPVRLGKKPKKNCCKKPKKLLVASQANVITVHDDPPRPVCSGSSFDLQRRSEINAWSEYWFNKTKQGNIGESNPSLPSER